MASMSASARTPAIPGGGGLKASRPYTLTVTMVDRFDSSDYLAIGVSTGAPATYAGLTGVDGVQISGVDSLSLREASGSTTVVAAVTFFISGFAEGDEVWVALFAGPGVPGPTDVPVLTAGPFIVAA